MGSFDYTCAVTGLPISAGTPVRFLLLTENPYNTPAEHTCYIDDRWSPRTLPILAKYNDYGSIEDYDTTTTAFRAITEQFKQDLLERGIGENQCHDVAVTKDMSFEALLNALWEGRVLVGRVYGKHKRRVPPQGIPTIRRVCRALQAAGHKVQSEFTGYLVSLQKFGFVRVRSGEFNNQIEALEKAAAVLKDYATMLTVAQDGSDRAELLVAPKPGNYEGVSFRKPREEHYRPRAVAQAMIREDVWQALLAVKLEDEGGSKGLQWFKDGARTLWDKLELLRKIENPSEAMMARLDIEHEVVVYHYLKGPGAVQGLYDAIETLISLQPTGEDKEYIVNTMGEMAYIIDVLSSTRYQWRPGSSNGPQCGAWRDHRNVNKAIQGIIEAKVQEMADDGYYDS